MDVQALALPGGSVRDPHLAQQGRWQAPLQGSRSGCSAERLCKDGLVRPHLERVSTIPLHNKVQLNNELRWPPCPFKYSPSIAFYTQVLGAKPMDEWKGMRLEQQGIRNLANLI